MIIGHRHILQFFRAAKAEGSLGHAYGFIGPGSVGKRALAKTLAAELLGTTLEKLETHPDYIYLERTSDDKTGKLKKNISVTDARALRERLQHTSWQLSGFRVVIVNEAELLNSEAANALLKILEEPPRGSIFFLLVENENTLLATIRSRLQLFYFSQVSQAEISAGLQEKGIASGKADLLARRSLGRPGRALQLSEEEPAAQYEAMLQKFEKLLKAPMYEKIQLVEEYFGDKEDGERGRQEWQRILEVWTGWFRDLLLHQLDNQFYTAEPRLTGTGRFSRSELLGIIDSLSKTRDLLAQNAHPRLAIETALLKF